jgi:hypothetical protein
MFINTLKFEKTIYGPVDGGSIVSFIIAGAAIT